MLYCHFLYAPMLHLGDDPVAHVLLGGVTRGRGSILFVSTAAQDLQYYQTYMSEEPYTLVPTTREWMHYGTVWEYDGRVDSTVSLASMGLLCGPVYSEGYVFDATDGDGLDLYLRCSSMSSTSLYYHYRLDAQEYHSWMGATWYEFVGLIDVPEWAWSASTSQ